MATEAFLVDEGGASNSMARESLQQIADIFKAIPEVEGLCFRPGSYEIWVVIAEPDMDVWMQVVERQLELEAEYDIEFHILISRGVHMEEIMPSGAEGYIFER